MVWKLSLDWVDRQSDLCILDRGVYDVSNIFQWVFAEFHLSAVSLPEMNSDDGFFMFTLNYWVKMNPFWWTFQLSVWKNHHRWLCTPETSSVILLERFLSQGWCMFRLNEELKNPRVLKKSQGSHGCRRFSCLIKACLLTLLFFSARKNTGETCIGSAHLETLRR